MRSTEFVHGNRWSHKTAHARHSSGKESNNNGTPALYAPAHSPPRLLPLEYNRSILSNSSHLHGVDRALHLLDLVAIRRKVLDSVNIHFFSRKHLF